MDYRTAAVRRIATVLSLIAIVVAAGFAAELIHSLL